MTLEYMRKPAIVQRVINSQINEIVGGGDREPIPADMLPRDRTLHRRPVEHDDAADGHDDDRHRRRPRPRHAARSAVGRLGDRATRHPARPGARASPPHEPSARSTVGPRPRRRPFEIPRPPHRARRPRRRGILSEEEFAAKKSQLLDRI